MKKTFISGIVGSMILTSFMVVGCSSGDDSPGDENNNGNNGNTSNIPTGTVPDNTDSGKNNNTEPDNVKPDDTGTENPDNSGGSPTWKLIFEDNFEGESSEPNPDYWTLAPKGDKTWNRHMSGSYAQAYQKDGYLYLFGMESEGAYLTGGIESRDKFDFQYGQVKCRARFLRQPQGNHTGIWMMPEPPAQEWPRSGEIDIMEHLNDQTQVFQTVHFWNEEKSADDKADTTAQIDNEEFNVYGIIWDDSSISFTVNGEVTYTYSNNDPGNSEFSYQYPFTKPFYLILSQSLGGEGTWEGAIDDSELPAIFQIDWIKVWQKSE